MSIEITRRRLLIAGLGLGATVLEACGAITGPNATATPRPADTATPAPTPDRVMTAIAENGNKQATAVAEGFKQVAEALKGSAPATAVARPTEAAKPSEVPAKAESEVKAEYKVALPTSYRPEDNGGVQNVFLPMDKPGDKTPAVVQSRWFHPMTHVEFMGNKEWVWSYDYNYCDKSKNLRLVQQGGEEGKMFFRQNHDQEAKLVFGVGKIWEFTDSKNVTQDLHGNVKGGEPMINIRTHPGVTVRVWNPDTGERLMVDGKPLEGVSSESGDIGFVLGWQGRYLFEADLPIDTGLETIVWEGPHDRTSLKLNIFDARPGVANQAASPAESASGRSTKPAGK